MRFHKISYIAVICLSLGIFSNCRTPSFYQKTYSFNKKVSTGQLDAAEKYIQDNQKMEDKKNRFLYWVNAGMVAHLKGDFQTSNDYFNKADLFIEDNRKSALEKGASFLLNPNLSTYYGEDHEVLLLHYYKAFNYYMLGQNDEALVEVRRLNLRLQQLSDKYKGENKYSKDAFMHVLMGMVYESNKDFNNAFIAYRNGYNIYKNEFATLFGLQAPLQLKKDLLRTAYKSGMRDELYAYEQEFGLKYSKEESEASVILLWNNGLGPVKAEWGVNFSIIDMGNGWIEFVNNDYGFAFPFYVGDKDFTGLTWVKVAFPKYVERKEYFTAALANYNQQNYSLELAQDINAISFKVLNERMMFEFSQSLIRVALKQVAAHEIGQSADSPLLGAALSVVASATESADTRNWQTLPHSLYYTRIPVDAGEQTIHFTLQGPVSEEHDLNVNLKRGETAIYPFYSLGAYDPILK